MARRRDLLHANKLEDFASWATAQGWAREPTKGAFEVLRLRKGGKMVLFHQRMGAQHVTAIGIGLALVFDWLRGKTEAWR